MYLFMFVAAPLSLLSLAAWFYSPEERHRHPIYIFKGMVMALPAAGLWFLLSLVLQPNWGSASLIATFWLRYWFLPSLLAAPAYGLAFGFRRLATITMREALSFLLSYLTVFMALWLAIDWGQGLALPSLLRPILLIVHVLLLAACAETAVDYGVPVAWAWLGLTVAASFLAASGYALLFMQLELAGYILSTLFILGAGGFAFWRLRHPCR